MLEVWVGRVGKVNYLHSALAVMITALPLPSLRFNVQHKTKNGKYVVTPSLEIFRSCRESVNDILANFSEYPLGIQLQRQNARPFYPVPCNVLGDLQFCRNPQPPAAIAPSASVTSFMSDAQLDITRGGKQEIYFVISRGAAQA